MHYYAEVRNGVCVGSLQTSNAIDEEHMIERSADAGYLLGWSWNGSTFHEPAPSPARRYVTVGAFFDRFGSAKYQILASTIPQVQALVTDCTVRKYIDLDNEDLHVGLVSLQSAGFAIDADAIISDPIGQDERP